jgi:ParB family chromosome partitioning protein
MRHDGHFVDQLTSPQTQSLGSMIEITLLEPNVHQPRRTIGDLDDLVASIKEKGILEPILVRKLGNRFQIIAGERRYHAAKSAGLAQVPCIEIDVDERGVLEISLIENLQRRNLDPFEEGDAILELCEKFAYTHDKVAQKLGKSRSSVTEILSIAKIPEMVREVCRSADISSKSLLLEIARQPTPELMTQFVERVAKERLTRDDARKLRAVPPPEERPENQTEEPKSSRAGFVVKLQMESIPGTIHLRFEQREVKKPDLISALRDLIQKIEASKEFPA